jgi:hypothetical protein
VFGLNKEVDAAVSFGYLAAGLMLARIVVRASGVKYSDFPKKVIAAILNTNQ